MNNICSKIVKINAKKIFNPEEVQTMITDVITFANKHGASFTIGYNERNELLAQFEIEGNTSMYCKGIVAEINYLLQTAFGCKLETLLYVS